VMRLKWKLVLVRLEIVLILMQGSCMVCTERTISSEIILDAPLVVLGDKAQVKACFGPFRDSANFDVR
jgi:hypothetical protein